MFLGRPATAPPRWLVLLTLGRISNLPTVWSNCLAGWWLGNGASAVHLVALCAGASLLYVGGMYLNDYCDLGTDRRHRPGRPLPAGYIDSTTVLTFSLVLLAAGAGVLVTTAKASLGLVLLLTVAIAVYDVIHKVTSLSPHFMAACRFLLYLVAASAGRNRPTGMAIWAGAAMAGYVAGLSYLARQQARSGPLKWWPVVLLALPIGLAMVANAEPHRQTALWLSFVLAIWVIPCLRHAYGDLEGNVGFTVSGLLAGIVLVDLLAVAGGSATLVAVFAVLFLLALIAQRYVPAD